MFFCIFFLTVFVNVFCSECEDAVDCITNKGSSYSHYCGLCIDHKCHYYFNYLFDYTHAKQRECMFNDQCRNRHSKTCNNADCRQGYGEIKCICKSGLFGKNCDIRGPPGEKYAFGVHNSFPWIILQEHYTPVEMAAKEEGRDAIFTVRTSEGYFAQERSYGKRQSNSFCETPKQSGNSIVKSGNNECNYKYPMQVRFPYREYKVNTGVKGANDYVGYWAHINFTVTNNFGKIQAYHSSFKIFVSYILHGFTYMYFNKVCVAMIKLQNCGKTIDDPTVYTRASAVNIESFLTFYSTEGKLIVHSTSVSDCSRNTNLVWMMWNIDRKQTHNEQTQLPSKVVERQNYLEFIPFTLKIGLYKFVLETKYIKNRKQSINSEYCYIELQAKPFIVIIDQGKEIYVRKEDSATLTAYKTKDPNFPGTRKYQAHLELIWRCTKAFRIDPQNLTELSSLTVDIEHRGLSWQPFYLSPDTLEYDTKYIISLTPSTTLYLGYDAEVQKIMTFNTVYITLYVASPKRLAIHCLKNCRSPLISNRVLILQALSNTQVSKEFVWTYFEEGKEPQSVDDIRILSDSSRILIVKASSLERGANYTFEVTEGDSFTASYNITTDILLYEGDCTISPLEGVKGQTLFDITCAVEKGFTRQYEFYDKYSDEIQDNVVYSGRMLGTSYSGTLYDFRLTRGNVIAYIVNNYGLSVSRIINVTLFDWEVTPENITDIKDNLTQFIQQGEEAKMIRYISCVPDIFPRGANRQEMLILLLSALYKCTFGNMAQSKLGISALKNVVVNMNKEKDLYLATDAIKIALYTIYSLTKVFSSEILRLYTVDAVLYISPNTSRRVAANILDCLYSTIVLKANDTIEIDEDVIDFDILMMLKLSSEYVEETLDYVLNVLSYLQWSGEPVNKITSTEDCYSAWAVVNHPLFPINKVASPNDDAEIKMSNNLMNELVRKARDENLLTLQVLSTKQNVFWWSRGFVKSDLLSIMFASKFHKGKLGVIQISDYPLDIYVPFRNISLENITYTVMQLDENLDELYLDLKLNVHRLDPSPGSFLEVEFIFSKHDPGVRVLISKDYRPSYFNMTNESRTMDVQSPVYPVNTDINDNNTFYYMGVLPGTGFPTNQTETYTFKVNTIRCQSWKLGKWVGRGCQVVSNPDNRIVHCLCTHATIFSVGFPKTSHELNPFLDHKLFMTTLNNYKILFFLLLLLVLYILLSLWATYKDYKDKMLRKVTILHDNFPRDKHPYLVSVWTSGRYNAGTTAHVAIQLIGEESESRVHILHSNDRKVLKGNSDDWFIILSQRPLGILTGLQMWHDNHGSSPSWHCRKVCVYDIKNRLETIFIVDEWLELRKYESLEVYVLPTGIEVPSVNRTFYKNVGFGMRETHIVTSIVLGDARSFVTRLKKVNILMCYILIALLCSVFYFSMNYDAGVDENEYKLGKRELLVGLAIMILNFVVIDIITLAFRKSVKNTKLRNASRLNISTSDYEAELATRVKSRKFTQVSITEEDIRPLMKYSIRRKLIALIYTVMGGRSEIPVQLESDHGRVKIRKMWDYIAWTICILLIIVSSLLVIQKSLKLGNLVSLLCVTTTALAISGEVLILGPIKIMVISIMFSWFLEELAEASVYNVDLDALKKYRKIYNTEKHYLYLIKTRSQPMYVPLKNEVKLQMLQRRIWVHNWTSILDFSAALLFVITLSYMVSHLWSSFYFSNSHVKTLFTVDHSQKGGIDFHSIVNTMDMDIYLHKTLVQAIFVSKWYNGDVFLREKRNNSIEQYYRTSDSVLKMIGSPILRQLRVESVPCIDLMNPKNLSCIPSYQYDKEDKSTYAAGWMPDEWFDDQTEESPWRFTERPINWFLKLFRCYGASHKELNFGGYIVSLGTTRAQYTSTLTSLVVNNWLNSLTRAVVLDLTIYSVNTNLFSQVTLFVEYSVTGVALSRIQVYSFSGDTFHLSHILFVGFIVVFILRVFLSINQQGVLKSLKYQNVLQIIIIVLGCAVIVILALHFKTSSSYVQKSWTLELMTHFDFDKYASNHRIVRILMTILMFIAIIRVLCLLRFGKFLSLCYFAFMLTLNNSILLLVIVILSFLVQWMFIAFLLSIITQISLSQSLTEPFNEVNVFPLEILYVKGFIVFIVVSKIITFSIMWLFVAVFAYYLKVARKELEIQFNIVSFIFSDLRTLKKYIMRK